MTKHHYSFPVVTGIDGGDPLASRQSADGGIRAADRRIWTATAQHLSEQISEIDLTDPEDARVLMPEQGADILAHFGDDQFLARYQRYKAHIAEWRQQYPRLTAVDLRYDQQVVLKMAPGAGASADHARRRMTGRNRFTCWSAGRELRDCRSRLPAVRAQTRSSGGSRRTRHAARPKAGKDKKNRKHAAVAPKRTDAARHRHGLPAVSPRIRVTPGTVSNSDEPETGQSDCGAGHRQHVDTRAGRGSERGGAALSRSRGRWNPPGCARA